MHSTDETGFGTIWAGLKHEMLNQKPSTFGVNNLSQNRSAICPLTSSNSSNKNFLRTVPSRISMVHWNASRDQHLTQGHRLPRMPGRQEMGTLLHAF